MYRRVSLAALLSCGWAFTAQAQDSAIGNPDPVLYTAQAILLFLGMAFTAYWAYAAFNAPPIRLGDGPTLPRYMTQPSQYRMGAIAFVAICLLVYALIAYFHKEFLPLIGIIAPELYKDIEKSTTDGSLAYPLVVVFAAAIFVVSLRIESDWNPLLVLRRVVHGWVSIPQLANAFMVMARDELITPQDARKTVVGDPDAPYVTIGDFDKDRRSLDRRWAELCYIRLWLEHNRAQGSHLTFFNEACFAWQQLQAEFDNVRDRIAPLKRGEVTDTNIFADVVDKVDALRRQYCRLAACFLVFKNETRKNAIADARQFGLTVTLELPRANPLRYVGIFLVAIMIAIYFGVSLSAMTWDLLHHNLDAAFGQDPDLITRWIGFALANYGMPILAVLLLRYMGWRVDAGQPDSYFISYASMFLVAVCVSAICLALSIWLAGASPAAALPFPQIVFASFKWSISPAIVAIYVAYHIDRQIDPLLPDLGSYKNWRMPQRLMSCVFFGMLVTMFSALPALSIPPNPSSIWPVNKLRLVVIGTTFVIGVIMAVVGEFFLVKPKAAADH